MSLSEALRGVIDARGLRVAEVVARVSGARNGATFYRMLNGDTPDPYLSTVVELCNVLGTTPGELLRLAGQLDDTERAATLVGAMLRQAFGELQELNDDDRRRCLAMLRGLIEMRADQRGCRPRRPGRPT